MLLTFCVLIVLGTELYWFWQSGHVIDGSEGDGSSTELRCKSSLLASETLHLEVLPRLHHGRAGSTDELPQNHWRSDASASGRSGTAYERVARRPGADGLQQAYERGTAAEQHSVGSRGMTTKTARCRPSISRGGH